MQLLKLSVKVFVHPSLAPPEGHFLSGFELQFNEGFWEKLSGENDFTFKLIAFCMSFNKDIFDLSEFVVE